MDTAATAKRLARLLLFSPAQSSGSQVVNGDRLLARCTKASVEGKDRGFVSWSERAFRDAESPAQQRLVIGP